MALKWGQRDSYGFELGCHTVKSALVAQYSFLETPAARSVLLLWAQNFLVAGRIPTSEHQEKNAPLSGRRPSGVPFWHTTHTVSQESGHCNVKWGSFTDIKAGTV